MSLNVQFSCDFNDERVSRGNGCPVTKSHVCHRGVCVGVCLPASARVRARARTGPHVHADGSRQRQSGLVGDWTGLVGV